jgi:hypothetical protein
VSACESENEEFFVMVLSNAGTCFDEPMQSHRIKRKPNFGVANFAGKLSNP